MGNTISGYTSPTPPAAPASSSAQANADQPAAPMSKDAVAGEINKFFESRKKGLGEGRATHMRDEIKKDMEKWLAENPNATEQEIGDKFKEVSSKKYGYEFSNKLRDDAFVSKMKRRMKELLSDRWE